MRSLKDTILQNIEALQPEYIKELLDFTFTLLEKQEREKKNKPHLKASERNKEVLAQIRTQIKEQKDEQDLNREIWKKS